MEEEETSEYRENEMNMEEDRRIKEENTEDKSQNVKINDMYVESDKEDEVGLE